MSYSAKQRKVKVQVEGADEIVRTLKLMEDAAGSVLMKGAKAGGKIALDHAKANCPVDTGALRDSLSLSDAGSTNEKATVKVDYDKSIRYGTFVELGTRRNKANPFLRNAVDQNIDKINEEVSKTISDAIGGVM